MIGQRLHDEAPPFWSARYWPVLLLIGLAGPFWVVFRGWFHARMLAFTLLGFVSILPALFLVSLALVALGAKPGTEAHALWPQLLWPLDLHRTAPGVLTWVVAWIGLSLTWHLLAALFAPARLPSAEGGGRFLAVPSGAPDSFAELMMQWILVGCIVYAVWVEPAALAKLGVTLDPRAYEIGVALNAGAFLLLSLLIHLNGGHYPGFPRGGGAVGSERWRGFRFVSRLRVGSGRSEGLKAVFSRRDPALKRIAGGE